VEELYDLILFHVALFIVGLALTMAPQKSLKLSCPCGEKLFIHYELVVASWQRCALEPTPRTW
jgi:hypothetical protein